MRYFKTIAVALNPGTKEYPLPTQAGMTGAKIVSIRTRRVGKTLNGQSLAPSAVFDTAMLTLRDATCNQEVVENLPFAHVDQVTVATGKGLELSMGELDFASSKISVQDPSVIGAGMAMEITFEFIK